MLLGQTIFKFSIVDEELILDRAILKSQLLDENSQLLDEELRPDDL
ncbi:641_t:CDS:2 [Gigaspora margarita]|uniref:641_t:CDS:1 n=1 Tax=Gigaspora margarita TaxID=4874 RepID=A0ABN7UI11_GIGMA|nr:641_t:CDS:2 [Gigaspora margarita]